MTRLLVCGLFLFGATARAGELDKEFAPVKVVLATTAKVAVVTPSELDKESPTAAGHGGGGGGGSRGGGGGGHGGGWGGGGSRGGGGSWGGGGYHGGGYHAAYHNGYYHNGYNHSHCCQLGRRLLRLGLGWLRMERCTTAVTRTTAMVTILASTSPIATPTATTIIRITAINSVGSGWTVGARVGWSGWCRSDRLHGWPGS